MRCALRLALLPALVGAPAFAFSLWPFSTSRFTKNELIQAGDLGIGDQRIIAFGDFNGDQYLDALTLDNDQQTLSVYLWNHDNFAYKRASSTRHPAPVVNAVPGDFTHDGTLDVLVMSTSSKSGKLDMALYLGKHDGSFEKNTLSISSSTDSQPIPADIDGDLKIDLLGVPYSQWSTSSLTMWQNVWNASQSNPTLFNLADPKFNGTPCTPANPHSNAVIDFDGDCLADLFLLCDDGGGQRSFEIWLNKKEAGFTLAQRASLPSGVQSVSFADMDRDGTTDMVFVTCSSVSQSTGVGSGCSLHVAYNVQLPLCESTTTPAFNKDGQRVCRQPENLCVSDPNFHISLEEGGNSYTRVPFSSFIPGTTGPVVLDTTFSPSLPLPVRIGDANLDGYPDLAFIFATTDNAHTPALLFSEDCSHNAAGCSNKNGKRGWRRVTKGADALGRIRDAKGVAFLDVDEDGSLDLLVQRTGAQGEGSLSFIQNNFYYDAFFLKAIVLNGACDNGWCTDASGSSYSPFGVSYSGATYKYAVLDTQGKRSAALVGQLPQMTYHSLGTPYAFVGLGRTNNYIERLFAGSTRHAREHATVLEGVIPNSRVVLSPPPPSSESIHWKKELFLRPGEWIPWVTVVVIAATGVLAAIVGVLHMSEKRADELERRRTSHSINFDAL
ncbi:hypothetical protein CONPUDRAFT_118448 [Coniophora puteana RWD-64-598 SS2]|uniref:T-cell immunomodulatory protein TIP C2 domain-containing protein n=1 Tax=Coniophora puteana (strain RWD-64-598) TaxID=741705 RepID=A0A5M3N3R7_CONPW|nr:uncharacterized protein CONPUDRAFT_118448 [Coniophora puteana RWD-64-598 SS2]EIW85541.1 hypothetical protein CONPUDRAFT_118448 [Coniophora puteana RWD-64-598 SS2]